MSSTRSPSTRAIRLATGKVCVRLPRTMPLDEALARVGDDDPEMTTLWDDWGTGTPDGQMVWLLRTMEPVIRQESSWLAIHSLLPTSKHRPDNGVRFICRLSVCTLWPRRQWCL